MGFMLLEFETLKYKSFFQYSELSGVMMILVKLTETFCAQSLVAISVSRNKILIKQEN